MPQLRVRGQELLKLFLFIYQSSTLSVSVTVKNAVWRGELKWGLVGGAVGRCSRKNLQEIMHFGFDGTSCMKLETVNQTVWLPETKVLFIQETEICAVGGINSNKHREGMNSLLSGLRSSLTSAGKLNSSSHIPVMEIKACIYEERGFFLAPFLFSFTLEIWDRIMTFMQHFTVSVCITVYMFCYW